MRVVAPFLVLVALLVLAASADRPRPPADVVMAQRADAFTLDPQRMSWQQDLRAATGLYECLLTVDDVGNPIEGVAERWEVSEDGRRYRFFLRPDARWSNGDPVTAQDFVYSWRRALLPDSAADYSGFLLDIEGAEDFFRWREEALARYATSERRDGAAADALWQETLDRFERGVGLVALDEHTLEVRLRRPVAYFLDLVAFPALSPVHPPTVDAFASIDPETGRVLQRHGWTKPGVLVGNGPYRLVAWRYKRDMRLERNPHYWNPAGAQAESIEIRVIEDANTALLAAEAGGIDWLAEVLVEYRADLLAQRKRYEERHRSELDRLLAEGRSIDEALALLPPPERGERRNVHGLKAFGTDFYSFNCRPTLADGRANPFADARVRRAFALTVDKRLLVERVTRLNEPISNVLVPPDSIPGYDGPEGLPFDPERARRELADAGWIDRDGDGRVEGPDGRRFPTVDLLYSTGNPRYRDLSLALRDMWQSRLGIEVVTRGKETKDFREDLKEGRFMIARGGWYGDYGDPTTWLDLSRSTDGNNDRKYVNPAYDAMLDDAADEPDPARRFAILAEAERFLMEEEIPILPICTFLTVYWYEPGRFTGLTHHPRLDQYLGRIRRVQPGATEAH